MKPTGLYYAHLNYPYEFRCFRLGRSTWRFNAENLNPGMFANYLFSGDDEAANEEFARVKKRDLGGFKEWR